MNRTVQSWFTDPQFKESFQDRPYSEKKRIMETYFKENLAAGDEEFEALPDTEKQRALYNFVYLNMAPHKPEPESRGWISDIGSAAAGGFVGAGETLLRTARTVGDVLVGEEAPEEEWTSRALEKLEDYRQASPYLQPSKEATEGLRRWVYEGVQAVVQSVTAQGPATAVGLVAGGPVAAVGMYALSGGSLYGFSAYDEFMETADQRGIDRSVSQPAALKHGIAEGGFEFVTDIVEGITAGIARPLTRPGKQALKNGIKSLLETRAKEVATRIASVATIETGAEMTTAGVQAEIARDVDMGDERFWSAAQHAFGPSMVAGLIFGGMGAGITTLQRREIAARLTDPKADKKKRLDAVAEVGNELRRYSPEMANAWMINAAICVSKNQAISLEEDLTPPDAGKESADAPLAAAGQSVTDIGKTPGTVKQAGEQAREAEKQAEESQEAVNQTIKAAIDEKHAPEDAQTLLARIEESEKALSPGQVEFIRDRVEKLGSVEAAAQAYPGESVVDTFARALAEQRWGAAKTGQTPAPSADIASDIASDITIDEEPSLPPESPPPGPEITPQTIVEKANKARPEIELIYNGMQEGAGNVPGVHLFTFKDPETGNHPSFAVPGELSEEKLAEAIDRKIAEFKGAKEEPASPAAQEETISIEDTPGKKKTDAVKILTGKGKKGGFVHDHSSTQINLPKKESDEIRSFANKIPDTEIYEDPNDDSYGREKEPHVTVRYGMDTLDPKEIAPAFEGFGPIKAKMGKVSIFETDKYDVVKVDIESEDLQAANKRVGETVELPGETFKGYKPHATIAYVKKGEGKKYVGDTSFEGKEITVDRVVLVAKDGKTHEFKLKEQGKKEPWEMTRAEYVKSLGLNTKIYPPQKKRLGARLVKLKDDTVWQTDEHGQAVYNAFIEDKPVPAEVLEEYKNESWAKSAPEEPEKFELPPHSVVKRKSAAYGTEYIATVTEGPHKDAIGTSPHSEEDAVKDLEKAIKIRRKHGIGVTKDQEEEVFEKVTLDDYGLTVEKTRTKNGNPVWEITGENTRKYKDYLKRAGARWYKFKKAWSFYQEEDPTAKILESLPALESKPEKETQAKKTPTPKPKKSDYPVFVDPYGNEHTCYLHGVSVRTGWEWYATEPVRGDIAYGYIDGDFQEWGSFSISELKENKVSIEADPKNLHTIMPPRGWTKKEPPAAEEKLPKKKEEPKPIKEKLAAEMSVDELLAEWDRQAETKAEKETIKQPSIADKAKETKEHISNAIDAFKQINEILGEKGAIGHDVDEKKWELIRPLLKQAWDEILAAGKSGAEFVALAMQNLSPKGRPYFEKFVKEEIGQPSKGEGKKIPAVAIADQVVSKLASGDEKITAQELFKWADDAYGGTQAQGSYTPKDAYDALELGVNRFVLDQKIGKFSKDPDIELVEGDIAALKAIINRLPTHSKRTEEMDEYQQFSTPPPLSYVANWAANITKNDNYFEPSAGTGGLAIFGKTAGAHVAVNELSKRRGELLAQLGFDTQTAEDAVQISNISHMKDIKPTVIVMNPPFSATAGRKKGTRDTREGARHIEAALKKLEPNGRLVAIVGRGMAHGTPAFKEWWEDIESKYNVRADVGISGQEYQKYGTVFDNRLLIIDKTGPTTGDILTGDFDKVEQLPEALKEIRDDRVHPGERTADQSTGERTSDKGKGGRGPEHVVLPASSEMGLGVGESEASLSGPHRPSGSTADLSTHTGSHEVPGRGKRSDVSGKEGKSDQRPSIIVSDDIGTTQQPSKRDATGIPPAPGPAGELQITAKEKEAAGELSDSLYEGYRPERLNISDAKRHPTPLVQSAAMAAVTPLEPTYKPFLPVSAIKNGAISDIQLESVVYAGQAHNEMLPGDQVRKGYFIGDGTGVGKGREIAAIFWDNWAKGRKKGVWISEKASLFEDAKRDVDGVGWNSEYVFPHNKIKAAAKIQNGEGLLFTTYDTLKSAPKQQGVKSRLDQIAEWLGEDFDGVIAFDESHNMGNAIEVKTERGRKLPSKKALTGVELQSKLPNARVLYVSATGATEVINLAYCDRLGLWGEGTAFATKNIFVTEISSGGMAAMELVARDMKALGVYNARSLSYDGVEYERLEHTLSDQQVKQYNKIAEGWQAVLRNIHLALEITGASINGHAKSAAMSSFWGGHQRFFNQIVTAMQLPSVLKSIHKDLENGNSVVIQLTNTLEASQERAFAKLGEDDTLEDLDLSPFDTLMQLIEHSFPTQQYEEYTDDNENVRSRPVIDSHGDPVQNADAVAMKEELLNEMGALRREVADNPLDQIIEEFGANNVAEITGRRRRVILATNKRGEEERVIEKRSRAKSMADADAFMEGKKRILVFSEAGGTGRSYHADLDCKNKERRIHYLLQPGWRADKAVQGLGRTHRSNQKQPPKYILCTTNLKGQKRFLSSIARRLDQLGALTKGQRQTGSQGLLQARDNLESDYARDALRNFFVDLAHNDIEGLSPAEFEEQTGLKITDEYGNLVQQLPPIRQFLNRLLSLNVDIMDRVFDEFSNRMDDIINAHVETGTLDQGLETLKADTVEKVKEEVVYTAPGSGAETKYVHLKVSEKIDLLDYEEAENTHGIDGFYKNIKSERLWAVRQRVVTNRKTGIPEDIYHLTSCTRTRQSLLPDELVPDRYEKLSAKEAEKLWNEELKKAPKTISHDEHLISGSLLPIWNRLRGHTRIMRVQTVEGERMIGRIIPRREVESTLANLGASSSTIKMTAEEIHSNVLDHNYSIRLANDWKILRRKVSGEWRIELKGPMYRELDLLSKYGVFMERINYDSRYFIPTSSDGIATIESIIKNAPIVQADPPVTSARQTGEGEDILHQATEKTGKVLPTITRENIQLAFEGAYVAPHGAEGNFKVNLPNGAHALVEKTGRLTVSQKWLHQYRPDLEGKAPPISRGGYSPKRRTIYLTTLAGQDTVDEETFHAAVDIALTDQEKAILERDYGDEEKQASEYVAWVADERRKPHTIFQKILDFFRRIQEIFFPTGKGAFAKVKSGEVWKRPARPPQGQELSQAARRLINTPEFKRWFNGSKVVAENGEPPVVYHGTSAPTDFDSFAPDISDLGSHFTVEPAVASYITGKSGPRRVFPVYLSIKNPLRLKDTGQWDFSHVLPQLKELGIASAKEIEEIETRIHESPGTVQAAGDRFIREFLLEKGYDGIVYLNRRELIDRGETSLPMYRLDDSLKSSELSDEEFRAKFPMARDSYIAFEPTQIKSIHNRGTFSETDMSILHQAQEPGPGAEFVKAPDGSIDFGRIDEKIGKAIERQPGPIRLQAGEESNAAKYGLAHIKARHGEEILNSGTVIEEFVHGVTSNWTEIRKGNAGSLFLVKRNGENDIAVVKLRPGDGEDFYTVVTAWRTKRDTIDKKKLLWERSAPARSSSGVDPRLQPSSQTRPEGEPPNASSQSSSEKTITASEDEVKPEDDLLYQLQPAGPQITRDLEEDRSFANRIFEQRDLGVHRAQLETQELQKQVQALTGKASRRRHVLGFAYDTRLKRSMESDRLDMAMMVWRDLQINPEKADEFKAWAKEALADPETPGKDKIRIREQFDTLERALALTDDQKALVDEIGSRFDRAFQVARANNIVNTFTDHYVRRIWNLPAGKEEDLRSTGTAYGFKTYTTAKQKRKFVTMIDGWKGGYDLKVKGLTNSYGAYITDLETILANKDFIRQGYHTRDTSGNRLFSTSKKSGYEKLEASGFKVHEWAGKAEAETPPDGSQALLIDDRGRRFFYGPIERVPESWAVFKDDETKHPSRVFYDPDEASDWAAEKGYDRIEHRPEKDVANAWEERPLYAPKQLAGIINRMTRSDRLFSGTPGADALLRFNAGMKSWILLSSFFHHLAGARSWAFAVHHGWKGGRKLTDPLTGTEYRTAGVNPVKAYKAGLKKVEDRHPLITLGVKNGLTLGDIQDWSETMLRDRKGFSERLANYLGLETAVKTMEAGRFFRERFTDALFKKYFAGLKAEAFVMEYIHDLQRAHDAHVKGGPAPDPDAIAERVARLINEDFGGLHLQRMGRNPTLQKISRLLLLASDWTESNFRTVTGLIPGLNNWIDRMTGGLPAPKGMNEVYRKFWGRVALRIAASTILAQAVLNGKDDTDDFWKEQALSNRFHKFRWTQVDITKIYEVLGIDPDARMTFSIGGHFLQPLNLFDPPRLIKAKSSPLARIVESVFSGTDWAQRPFTAAKTLFGKGRTVKGSPYEETEGFFNRLPSTVANQITGMQPIQVGYLIRYLQGEADGLSSIMGSVGIATHKAWPPRKTEPIARAEENDPAYDLVSDLADEELLRLGPPSGKIVVNGIPRKLTREQYEQYFEKSSEIARRKLKMVMKSAAFAKLPKEKQARIVGNVIQSARKKARASIKQQIIRDKAYTKPAVDRKAAA